MKLFRIVTYEAEVENPGQALPDNTSIAEIMEFTLDNPPAGLVSAFALMEQYKLERAAEEAAETISAVPATPQSAERATDNRQTGTSSPAFSSEPSEHFRAPSNMEEPCHLCGQKIEGGQIIVDAEIRGEAAYAHEACVEEREEDMREEGVA